MSANASGLEGGRLIPLKDADLQVYETGPATGRPLVLLHGFLTSAFTWRHVYPVLARQHRVFLVDLPGSGRSSDPRAARWPAERCVNLLEELLDALDLPAPTLIGSQMGASLAAWFAATYRQRVDRLVLIAAGALGEAKTNLALYRLLAHPVIGPWFARRFPRSTFEDRWRAAHGPGYVADPAILAYYFEQFRTRGHAMARVGLDFRRSYGTSFDELAGAIRGLVVPTLLIFGGADSLVPVSTGRRFEDLLLDARLVIIPGCGDFPQEEHPDKVTEAISGFLSSDT